MSSLNVQFNPERKEKYENMSSTLMLKYWINKASLSLVHHSIQGGKLSAKILNADNLLLRMWYTPEKQGKDVYPVHILKTLVMNKT